MMSKVSSRWVPRMLTPEQKACHQQFSEENLNMLRANLENLFSRNITGYETWVYHHDPETRVHALEIQGIPYSEEISCAIISRKDHSNSFFFWDSEGVLVLEFMPHKTTITYWKHPCFHSGGITRAYKTETPWKVVGWCPAATWQCTCTQVTRIAGCY